MNYSVMNLPRSVILASRVVKRINEIMYKLGKKWTGFISPDFTEGEVNLCFILQFNDRSSWNHFHPFDGIRIK
jgi:hypothetical protein